VALQDRQIWIDGDLVPFAHAQVHLLSQSLQRGTLIFDVMPVYRTAERDCVLGLREHVERFFGSAQLNQMQLRVDAGAVIDAIGKTVRANPRCDIVKVSGYYPGISLDILPVDTHASVAIAALDETELHPGFLPPLPPARLQIAASPKMPASVLSPQVKIAASYTHASIAKRRALADGFDDVLFLDSEGQIAESSTSSFFLVIEGRVCSGPLETVLAGVTRRAVIDLAREESLEVVEGTMPGDWLERADEAFLTGTTTEVRPVARIDALELEAPGPISARLRARFDRMTAGDDPLSARWMQPV
jgi:branched-chain amino acid aminotransferase